MPEQDYTAASVQDAVADVRYLIPDTATPHTLDDDHIARLLRYNGAPTRGPVTVRSVRLAAAEALDVIASSEVLISKVIRTASGISTDGAKVSAELRARAAQIRVTVEATDTADIATAAEALDGGYDTYAYGAY